MVYKTLHRQIRIDQNDLAPLVFGSHSCPSLIRFDSQDMWIENSFLLFIKFQIIVFHSRTVRTNSHFYACICIKKLVYWFYFGSVYLSWGIPCLKETNEKKYCLSIFDLRVQITFLVSSTFSLKILYFIVFQFLTFNENEIKAV